MTDGCIYIFTKVEGDARYKTLTNLYINHNVTCFISVFSFFVFSGSLLYTVIKFCVYSIYSL